MGRGGVVVVVWTGEIGGRGKTIGVKIRKI